MGGLEQRVQVVEQELQLLKGQIQTILLQIQEHLLTSTYPMLRAQEPGKVSLPEVAASSFPVKRVSLTEPIPDRDSDAEESADEVPKVRSVTYAREPSPAPQLEPGNGAESPAPQEADKVHSWLELDQWVSQKVHELGIERTRELVDLFGGRERDLLLQFVNVYDENAPKPASAVNGKPVNSRVTLVPQTRAVVDEIRAEQGKQEADNSQKAAITASLNKQQELVLRLIAGVLGAREEAAPVSTNGNGHRKH